MRVTQMDATHSQHRIRFEVHDSGIGIDQETQKCLFQPFAQADTSASNQARGTGLGLATCRNLVDLLNGSIGITSDTGTGSTFWMGLPFGTTNHSPKKESFDLRPINHLSPLIVHSNNNARTALDYSMGKIGLKAESDDCLESALERMSQSRLGSPRVNLIILDAGNDSWNDFSEIKQFRKSEFARNIPILLLIPFSKCPQKEEARRLGIYGWVTKPVKPRHLHNALCSIFGSLKTSTIQTQKRKEHPRMEAIPPKASSAVEKKEEARILLAEDNKVNQRFATFENSAMKSTPRKPGEPRLKRSRKKAMIWF
ncbi:MAG TPA: response regulator [Verrucomicrobiales bacterium]|nr:response regulator [Verrucomicrobiales bacterium]